MASVNSALGWSAKSPGLPYFNNSCLSRSSEVRSPYFFCILAKEKVCRLWQYCSKVCIIYLEKNKIQQRMPIKTNPTPEQNWMIRSARRDRNFRFVDCPPLTRGCRQRQRLSGQHLYLLTDRAADSKWQHAAAYTRSRRQPQPWIWRSKHFHTS